jgi:integrase
MPKASRNVLATDREVKSATSRHARTDFRVRGALGLQLRVTASGTKTWALAYKSPATGKWAKVALGTYPVIGLAEAKGRALDLAAEVRKGHDPVHDKRQMALAETFEALAARYMREHEIRNARDGRRSRSTEEAQRQLDRDILPRIGRLRAESVTRQHVMHVVEAIADRNAYVAADRALGLIRAIYNWACGTGRLERNPTLGLKKRNVGRPKTRVLSPLEIGIFWQVIEPLDGITAALRDAYRLQLLTGARIGEVIGTPRNELNLERGLWTIAAIRTKAKREHALPLSASAVAIWRTAIGRADAEAQRRAENTGRQSEPPRWVFPSPRTDGPIDPHAATYGILRTKERLASAGLTARFNTHDLRRTVATQLGEMRVADELIERILNHAPRTVAGKHYNHAKYLGPMRRALDAWAERLHVIVSKRVDACEGQAQNFAEGR